MYTALSDILQSEMESELGVNALYVALTAAQKLQLANSTDQEIAGLAKVARKDWYGESTVGGALGLKGDEITVDEEFFVDVAQTVISGQATQKAMDRLIDANANFTPDLVGKTVYRVSATLGTDDGPNTNRLPDKGLKWAVIQSVDSRTQLTLSYTLFSSPADSMYYYIDNHTGLQDMLRAKSTAVVANAIVDSNGQFTAGLVGKTIWNKGSGKKATVTAFVSVTQLTLSADIFTATKERYTIELGTNASAFRYIQSAVNALKGIASDFHYSWIFVRPGTYREEVVMGNGGSSNTYDGVFMYGDRVNPANVVIKGSAANDDATKAGELVNTKNNSYLYLWGFTVSTGLVGASVYGTLDMRDCVVTVCNTGIFVNELGVAKFFGNSTLSNLTNGVQLSPFSAVHIALGTLTVTTVTTVFVDSEGSSIAIGFNGILAGNTITNLLSLQGGIFTKAPSGAITAAYGNYTTATSWGIAEGKLIPKSTAGAATAGVAALPATPEGFLTVHIAGVGDKKVPYYNV